MLTTHKGHKVGPPSLANDIHHGFFSQGHSKTGTLACATVPPPPQRQRRLRRMKKLQTRYGGIQIRLQTAYQCTPTYRQRATTKRMKCVHLVSIGDLCSVVTTCK